MSPHTFDLDASLGRFEAWWGGEVLDRPPVRPYLRREWDMLERSLFHLDGRDALRHLDWLIEEDWIQASETFMDNLQRVI